MNTDKQKPIRKEGIRVRFAPSPTGFLHIGASRVALFNHLFSKQNDGVFILRIEDTDKERSKTEFEKDIIGSLKWLGLKTNEGPEIGGDFGPYRQSERTEIYQKYIEQLLKEDKAYYCFCSPEDLKAHKEYQVSIGKPAKYSGKCSSLPKETVQKLLAENKPSVIRFRMSKAQDKKIQFKDLIRGKVEFEASLIDDFIIAKDISTPLYNLACAIDDFEMNISHVIRGEDHISNTPKQILIQEGLGFPTPKYAHLPLVLGPDKTKMSKRHGATSVLEYKQQGYLPEALINFMAFLGWNPGSEKEIYEIDSLIKEFSFERVQKSGAIFNIQKLDFLNGFYIRKKIIEDLTNLCIPYLIKDGLIKPLAEAEKGITQEYRISETNEIINIIKLRKIVSIYQERLKKLSEISTLTEFFFKDKLPYNRELLTWKDTTDNELKFTLERLEIVLSEIDESDFNKEHLTEILLSKAESFANEINKAGKRGYLLWPLRVALTYTKASASPFEIAEILGKEKTLKRIKETIEQTL